MKLKRMAVVAAAAVVGPTVLMATPAMADEAQGPAVTTPDTAPKDDGAAPAAPKTGKAATAAPKADRMAAPAPKAAEEEYVYGPGLALSGLPKDGFKAGGTWTEFTLSLDNDGKKTVTGFDMGISFSGDDAPLRAKHIELEYRFAGGWQAVSQVPNVNAPVFDLMPGATIPKNLVTDIPLRVRVADDAPATAVTIQVTGTNHTSVDSKQSSYASKITRGKEEDQQAAKAPKLAIDGLPGPGFFAGEYPRNLTLDVNNLDNQKIESYTTGVELHTDDKSLRASQIKVEVDSKPVVVQGGNGTFTLFTQTLPVGAQERRSLQFSLSFAEDAPNAAITLRAYGSGAGQGAPVSQAASYDSRVTNQDAVVDVEGPKMTLSGVPAGGFTAGADWQELRLAVDNAGRGDTENFLVALSMGRGFDEGRFVDLGEVRLQAYDQAQGWYDVELGGGEEVISGFLGNWSLAAGDKAELRLRLKFAGTTAPGAFHLGAWGYQEPQAGDDEFVSSESEPVTTAILPASSTGGGGQTGGGQTGGGNTGNTPKPDGGAKPITDTTGTTPSTPSTPSSASAGGRLATTGTDPATTWALGGAGVALAMGAALVAGTGRRRRPTA
ncbi:hypothetical protein [Streptomyces sp. NPDC091268]|uniref:hypothetical protein n=1 Tax=Streptomyces sp. NPDC091268 TaxID=3365979 RepID=UPI00382CF93B